MTCQRCGRQMPDDALFCTACGTPTSAVQANAQPSAHYYGQEQARGYYGSSYEQNVPLYPEYMQQPGYRQQQQPGYGQQQFSNPMGQPGQFRGNVVNNVPGYTVTNQNNTLLVEVLLSIFGIFGVGWLMLGETTVGTVLLVCSFVLYWPIFIGGTLLTAGLGLACLGPLGIGAIIVNAIMLNNTLKRKTLV